jgi:hypothetical protein
MNTKRYWQDDNGRITCEEIRCAGMYLRGLINSEPKAKKHSTPRGTYFLLSNIEVQEVASDGYGVCESCEWHNQSQTA